VRVDVHPRQAELVPGQPVPVTVTITNTSTVIGGYTVRLLGADPSWVEMDAGELSLFPDEVRTLVATITVPPGMPAGVRRVAVQVRELTPPHESAITDIDLRVPDARAVELRVDPMAVTGGRGASFSVVIKNSGNTVVAGLLAGDDAESKVRFAFRPPVVSLAPGEHAVVDMQTRARRPLMGAPTVRALAVRLDESRGDDFFTEPTAAGRAARQDRSAPTPATFIQKSVFSRGALSLVGLLIAVSVFAIVITVTLSRLVGQSTADRDLALQVAAARNGGASSGTSGISGSVHQLGSGDPLSAVSVSVYDAGNTQTPITTTATDDGGAYAFGQLPAGKYKIAYRRAGFIPIWYPAATSDADATDIAVTADQREHAQMVSLGGEPATLSGTVLGDDVSASTLYLETLPGGSNTASPNAATPGRPLVPATAPGGNPLPDDGYAVVQKVAVGADGTFELSDVPSPNVYRLVVTKTGYATTTQSLDVGAGEHRTGIELTVRKGDGLISGTVSTTTGPKAGVTLTATAGQSSVTTVSLSDAGRRGQFTVRGLPTPSTVTLTARAAGYSPQTVSVTLAAGQKLTGVALTLNSSTGALDGLVDELPAGHGAGGVTVSATDGLNTVQTGTQSEGQVGSWHLAGLPAPGTYTLTFTRDDLVAQTVSVSLDASGTMTPDATGARVVAGSLQVTMQPSTATVYGTVTQSGSNSSCSSNRLGEAIVTLNSGSTSYTVTSASVPASWCGQYRIEQVPPGTYTLTVAVGAGTTPQSKVVTLTAGQTAREDVLLGAPASLTGTLVTTTGKALPNWTVFLYTDDGYPAKVERTTTTDKDGFFRLTGLDAGDYVVAVGAGGDPSGAVKTVSVRIQPSDAKNISIQVAQ
jgi:Carboxypeptidase regulatory-like domain